MLGFCGSIKKPVMVQNHKASFVQDERGKDYFVLRDLANTKLPFIVFSYDKIRRGCV
jgi:hypothetical protein